VIMNLLGVKLQIQLHLVVSMVQSLFFVFMSYLDDYLGGGGYAKQSRYVKDTVDDQSDTASIQSQDDVRSISLGGL
jgi:hypothetical protein